MNKVSAARYDCDDSKRDHCCENSPTPGREPFDSCRLPAAFCYLFGLSNHHACFGSSADDDFALFLDDLAHLASKAIAHARNGFDILAIASISAQGFAQSRNVLSEIVLFDK